MFARCPLCRLIVRIIKWAVDEALAWCGACDYYFDPKKVGRGLRGR